MLSPGPSWTVLAQPSLSSSPSTRTNTHSDVDFDVDMGDDEADPIQPSISKRKASIDTDSVSVRRPLKLPRLEINGANGTAGRTFNHVVPSGTQHGPPSLSTGIRKSGASLSQGATRVQSAGGSSTPSSTSDFPNTISQRVQKINARDSQREREQEKERAQERERNAAGGRPGQPQTARKQTANPKHVRKVCTANLLKDAQNPSSDSRDESLPWTRVRPRFKQQRTSFNREMANSRPSNVARQRSGDSTIELTDSSDSTRRRRPSQPSAANRARPTTLANMDDPIVITSGSDDEPLVRPTQRRNGGPSGTQGRPNRPRTPPPADAEVISLTDSEDDVARPSTSASAPDRNRPSQFVIPPAPAEPPSIPLGYISVASQGTQPPEQQPLQNTEPPPSSPPFHDPPSDDIDDSFNNVDFDTGGDDDDLGGDLDALNVGTSLLDAVSSAHVGVVAGSGPEGEENASNPDALFESYLNMDQLGGDEGALPNGDRGEERAMEDVAPGVSTYQNGEGEGSTTDNPNAIENVRMQSLEEGEVDPNEALPVTSIRTPETPESGEIMSQRLGGGDEAPTVSAGGPNIDVHMLYAENGELPNDAPVPSTHTTGTPESGEIRSQESGGDARPPSSTAPIQPFAAHRISSASASTSLSPSSASPRSTASQPSALSFIPDISSYKGVRYKRSLPEARENPFFSRALTWTGRSGKADGDKNASASAPVEAPSSVGEVRNQNGDADMQDDAVVSMQIAVVSAPSPLSQQPEETTMVLDAQSTVHAQSSTVVTADDGPPPSTQPTPSSVQASPSEPLPATQPLARSSSRPIIAPPRVPLPGTPMSLVEVLNDVRRARLLKEERGLARKRSIDPAAAPPKSGLQGPSSLPPATLSPSARTLGKTPSLKDIRTLLASRNVASPSTRPTPTHTSNEDGESGVAESIAATTTTTTTTTTTDGSDRGGSSEQGTHHERVVSTPTPKTTTATTTSVSRSSARRKQVPFEAFISPMRLWSQKAPADGINKSPTAWRPRTMSTSMLDARGIKRMDGHGRRESAAAAFEAYIVRDSPRRETRVGGGGLWDMVRDGDADAKVDGDADIGTGKGHGVLPGMEPTSSSQELEHVEPAVDSVEIVGDGVNEGDNVSGLESLAPTSEQESELVTSAVDLAVGGTEVEVEVPEAAVDSTHVDYGESVEEVEETDVLLELASVHLSQPHSCAEGSEEEVGVVNEVDMMETGELPDEPAPSDTGDVMMVDASVDDVMTNIDPQPTVDDMPGQVSREADKHHPVEPGTAASSVPSEEHESLRPDISEERDRVDTRSTTPDLVLPENPELLSDHGCVHERTRSGEDESMDECDALLRIRSISADHCADVGQSEATSSRTASSTSLQQPRNDSCPSDLLGHDRGKDYQIVTWASYVAGERERPPEYKLAKDLPHSLQDHVHVLPESIRNSDVGRQIFEAHIQEAMVGDSDAPPIKIFDNAIGNEMTPRWEFHYTNEMWYAEGVPPPDTKNLESCGCVGRCDPKSRTCACAQRQRRWVQRYIDGEIIPPAWPGSPFVYDHKGMLQRLECPIFECNQFCSCDEDCPNRVVQNGRKWPVHIAKTAHKGWGVVAGNKKIPKGSYLGMYAGELLTEQEGDARGRYYDLYGRTYLFSIDFHHLKMDMENPEDWENLYVVDAYHAGNFTRFLNHSCDPNCKILACYIDDANIDKPLMTVFTTRDVEPWEELCFSYYGDIEEKREEISNANANANGGDVNVREHAVYAQCRCEAENCIGRLFS